MADTSSVDAVSRAQMVVRPSPVRVGTVVWLASELMFFAGLFAAYFTIRSAATVWPPPHSEVDALRAGLFTLVLLASSGTVQVAVHAAEHLDADRAQRWLLLTVVLGTVFLANQALEWRDVEFSISSHSYGSLYFLLTGFHGLHVLGGLLALVVLAARTAVEPPSEAQGSAVAVVGYYWHFVDAVWIALYATVFLVR